MSGCESFAQAISNILESEIGLVCCACYQPVRGAALKFNCTEREMGDVSFCLLEQTLLSDHRENICDSSLCCSDEKLIRLMDPHTGRMNSLTAIDSYPLLCLFVLCILAWYLKVNTGQSNVPL